MGRKSEKKKMERRIIISGVEYQIKRIRFNALKEERMVFKYSWPFIREKNGSLFCMTKIFNRQYP